MKAEAAQAFLRRCEVVMGAVSTLHATQDPLAHEGLPGAHGVEKISVGLVDGRLDIGTLAGAKGYSKAPWGFLNPYGSSESRMGLLASSTGDLEGRWGAGGLIKGPNADKTALGAAFGDLAALVRRDRISREALSRHEHLCLCKVGESADGEMLRNVLLDPHAPDQSSAGRRYGTARMLMRLMSHAPPDRPNADLAPLVAFGNLIHTDDVVAGMPITSAWRGVVLRWYGVSAWRSLWAGLVNDIQGLTPRRALADGLLDLLPNATVGSFVRSLPEAFDGAGNPAPAEISADMRDLDGGTRELAILIMGAQRVGRLDERVTPYFEGSQESGHDLTPSWMLARLQDWKDKPIQSFAAMVVDQMVARSQRVALAKAQLNRKTGVIKMPTRVFLRDDFIFRDSREGGGPVGLRWDQLATILGPLGLLERSDGCWKVTDLGRSYGA